MALSRHVRDLWPLLLTVAVCGPFVSPARGSEPAAPPNAEAGLVVPAAPADASAEDLVTFAEGLLPPPRQPRSQEELFRYVTEASRAQISVADKVLAQAKEGDALYVKAATLKLESLAMLGQLTDEDTATQLAAFATTLAKGPVKPLAMKARRMLLLVEARQLFAAEKLGDAVPLVKKTAALLAADPNDRQTVAMAMQLVGALEQVPDASAAAVEAMTSFGAVFGTSDDEEIRQLAAGFEGKLRLLSLPGKPMEIKGELLDGKAFENDRFAGKVVLVDFWATWCGPCVAEIPNLLEQYEKYHDKGFEVVGISLDENKADVEKFVADNAIPWPVIFAGKGWQDPVAQFYGITGIPQLVLIGRDGNVVSLDVRGQKLAERLAELFQDAG